MAPIFQGLGMFVGRALYDSRIIDLSLDTLKVRDSIWIGLPSNV
jgi:hypothetical protein